MPDFVKQSEQTAPKWLARFLDMNSIAKEQAPRRLLTALATAFSRLPYENLTKIIRDAQTGNLEEARRLPCEVLQDHWSMGAGGTCFSLTWTLLQLVRALGLTAEPILADRRYGTDTHCALIVWLDGQAHLLDPGYLLVDPLVFPKEGELIAPTSFNHVSLHAVDHGDKLELSTLDSARTVYRLTYKTNPVDTTQFLKAWDASFGWEMMTYPVVSSIRDGRQLYLQKNSLLIRSRDESRRLDIPREQLAGHIACQFGIAPHIIEQALAILQRRGERG